MLFTALKAYDARRIEAETQQYLEELHLSPEVLQIPLSQDISVGTLINGLTERLISLAAAEDRRRFRERQSEGIARAQHEGVVIGRPTRKQDKRFRKVLEMYRSQKVTGQEAARLLGVASSTFYRWIRQESAKE